MTDENEYGIDEKYEAMVADVNPIFTGKKKTEYEKLVEWVARKLSELDNYSFDDLKDTETSFNEGNPTKSHYLRRAKAILKGLSDRGMRMLDKDQDTPRIIFDTTLKEQPLRGASKSPKWIR